MCPKTKTKEHNPKNDELFFTGPRIALLLLPTRAREIYGKIQNHIGFPADHKNGVPTSKPPLSTHRGVRKKEA
jgi:hypothetical protein